MEFKSTVEKTPMSAESRTTHLERCSWAPDADRLAVGSQAVTFDPRKKAR